MTPFNLGLASIGFECERCGRPPVGGHESSSRRAAQRQGRCGTRDEGADAAEDNPGSGLS